MDIHSYFRSASKSSVVSSSNDSEDGNEFEIDAQPNPPKKHCSSSTSKPPSKSGSGIRRYIKKWEETFPWLEFDENLQGTFFKLCKKGGRSLQRTGGAWITKPFTNWKKATQGQTCVGLVYWVTLASKLSASACSRPISDEWLPVNCVSIDSATAAAGAFNC